MYKIILLPDAEKSLRKIDKTYLKRITLKVDWLKTRADKIIHHPLVSLPEDLKGLCRIRVGDYRIIYWVYHRNKTIKIYEIEHRSKNYGSLR
jgi:mRNA interferase RelE/StbE